MANSYRCLRLAATDNIMANEYFTELLPKLAALDADLQLFYEVKANLRRDQIKLMAQAGIRSIQPGVESFNSPRPAVDAQGRHGDPERAAAEVVPRVRHRARTTTCSTPSPAKRPTTTPSLDTLFRKLGHLRPPGETVRVVVERFSPLLLREGEVAAGLHDRGAPTTTSIRRRASTFRRSPTSSTERGPNRIGNPEEYIAPAKAGVEGVAGRGRQGDDPVHLREGAGLRPRLRQSSARGRAPSRARAASI